MRQFLPFLKRKGNESPDASHARRNAGNALAFISLCFLTIILVDRFKAANFTAIISTYPLWIWGIIMGLPALVSWIFFYSRFGLVTGCLWLLCITMTNDHLPAMSRTGQQKDNPEQIDVLRSLRVISFNCQSMKELDPDAFASYHPQAILLQGIQPHHDLETFAKGLFGEHCDVITVEDCAIVTKKSELENIDVIMGHSPSPEIFAEPIGLIVEWTPRSTGTKIRLMNVNLTHTDPFKSIFSPSNWLYYSDMRLTHRMEIDGLVRKTEQIEDKTGEYPLILGGSFSVQASSPIFKPLASRFRDTYTLSASSYGSTFPSDFPLMRFDRVFVSSLITVRNCETIYVPGATRKAVFADICLKCD